METMLMTQDGLTSLIFLFVVAITVCGALIATNAKRLVRSVAGLSLCFIGVAGLYYFLNSPFVAMMEMLIYVGAVCVAIVFAIMLAEPRMEDKPGKQSGIGALLAFIAGALACWGVAAVALKTEWPAQQAQVNSGSLTDVGTALLTTHSMVFELISVVLLVAIIGALVLAQSGREKQ